MRIFLATLTTLALIAPMIAAEGALADPARAAAPPAAGTAEADLAAGAKSQAASGASNPDPSEPVSAAEPTSGNLLLAIIAFGMRHARR